MYIHRDLGLVFTSRALLHYVARAATLSAAGIAEPPTELRRSFLLCPLFAAPRITRSHTFWHACLLQCRNHVLLAMHFGRFDDN